MGDKASLSEAHAAHLEKALSAFIEKENRYERLKDARQKAELHGNVSKLDREFVTICINLESKLRTEMNTLVELIEPYKAQLMVHLEKKDEECRMRERCSEIAAKRHALQKMQKGKRKILEWREKMLSSLPCPSGIGYGAPQSPAQSEE